MLIFYGAKRLIGVFASLFCPFLHLCPIFSNSGHPGEPVDLVKEPDLELTVLDKVVSVGHDEEPEKCHSYYPDCWPRRRTWRPH